MSPKKIRFFGDETEEEFIEKMEQKGFHFIKKEKDPIKETKEMGLKEKTKNLFKTIFIEQKSPWYFIIAMFCFSFMAMYLDIFFNYFKDYVCQYSGFVCPPTPDYIALLSGILQILVLGLLAYGWLAYIIDLKIPYIKQIKSKSESYQDGFFFGYGFSMAIVVLLFIWWFLK